ncbi:CDP-alcohol phosphatidyltransferase family protein [Roseisolibacter agri]|uniref:CDP-diacylglycerol--glycerol-3-phosphate 3-phosphatidyltransferase n=1 Tax=Roseisolibacter agri TaxID=2014610 RepID=A0AA37Q8P5_9BACT|nr:CDP-alcohol phosphatidyltransferase family protein [Roseisolibacter agri]GLC24366.1 CDP-alcohol phosphatidyltransferase [Roseisolibacter agri]
MSRGAPPPSAELWTLPNVVSLSRFVLAAGFLASTGNGERVALVGVASLTDFLDGWLARRRNAVSRWGALIDPLADRAFVLAAVTTLLLQGQLTLLQVGVLLLRDIMTAIGFLVARSVAWLRPVAFRARPLGKVVTALQLVTLVTALVWPRWVMPLVVVLGIVSVASTIDYTLLLWRERDRTLKP